LQLAGNSAEPIIKMANDDLYDASVGVAITLCCGDLTFCLFNRFKGKIDGVDLNCGCPQSFALEKGYGCALLRNPDHLADMCMQIGTLLYGLDILFRSLSPSST